ncbi:MAG: cysteine desulfurase [Pseudolabrys sp.]|nr:cysteine desulfurase [Pseudolabrys sp.]MBV9261136.1 cysteine desulfurase [Pseudolabrys sp.]
MNATRAYFDWNATALLRQEARDAVLTALELGGNASSVHGEGRAARALVEKARGQVAELVGAEPKNVTFTSGGTEANTIALTPHLDVAGKKEPRDQLLVAATEHPSVRQGGRFPADQVAEVKVVEAGILDLDDLKRALARCARPLVSIMLANNETGVIQPIKEIAEIVHGANGVLHVDAVQAAGKIPIDISALGADLMTISAHKIGGPQGAGALIKTSEIHIAQPMVTAGGQERGVRGGTENVPAIAGFGAAAAACTTALCSDASRLSALRDSIDRRLKTLAPDVRIFGEGVERLPNTTMLSVPGIKAETALIALDLDGIAVSTGSACSSGKVAGSPVLAAMGVEPDIARGAIRLSIGYSTTEADVEKLMAALTKLVSSLSKGQARTKEIAA